MLIEISKRKLESYKRAEAVAQECRRQFAENKRDENRLSSFVIFWMRSTVKKVCFAEPVSPKI